MRHLAKRDRQRCGQYGNRKQSNEICQRRRIRIRMRLLCVEETTAIGSQVFDEFQRGHWPLRDDLSASFQRVG